MKRYLECELYNERDSNIIELFTNPKLTPKTIANRLLTGKGIEREVIKHPVYFLCTETPPMKIWFNEKRSTNKSIYKNRGRKKLTKLKILAISQS